MVAIERNLGGDRKFSVQHWTFLFTTFGLCGLFAVATLAQEPPKAIEFREMRFTLPIGEWERSLGSPPSSQVNFTLNQGAGRVQTLSIWRVSYPKQMYGLAPEEHTNGYWSYEQFEKPRPSGAWVNFARSKRTIAGNEYPVLTYEIYYPSASNPKAVARGIFLAYFPNDFRSRERFYIFQWMDGHPPGVEPLGWERLDQVVASFTVGPVQE